MAQGGKDLSKLSAAEDKKIMSYTAKLDGLWGKKKIDWQMIADTKNLISFHEGRKSVLDEMLSIKQ